MSTGEYISFSKEKLRLCMDVVCPMGTVATAVLPAFLTHRNASMWWLTVPAIISIVAAVGSTLLTHSLERSDSPLDRAICGVLYQFHNLAFGDEAGHRVTLFRKDETGHIVATHRYSAGRAEQYLKRDGKFSKVRFREGRAIVGFAWERHNKLIAKIVPESVKTAQEYDDWARTELKMTDEELKTLSSRTKKQRFFSAWGFLDANGAILGVVAVDSKEKEPFATDSRDPEELFQQICSQLRFLLKP